MKDSTRNVLLGAAGAMLSAAAIREGISMAIDRNMVCEALERQEPKAMQKMKAKMKGCADAAEDMALCQRMEGYLASQAHERVQLASYDGTLLAGHLFRVEAPERVVLAMHGWRSGWARDFSMVSDFLRENRCTVLYAEQRGQGESGGEYMGFGMMERFDCVAWAKWLNENGFSHLPIYLVGISMGATTVLMAAGSEELPENVAGVVADCGFTSARDIWKHISEKNLGRSYDRRQRWVDALCRRRIDFQSDSYSTLDAMKTARVPVLFVHGAEDTFVPVEMTLRNYEACTAPKGLLIVEGANHGMSYVEDRRGYEAAVREFWRQIEEQGMCCKNQ